MVGDTAGVEHVNDFCCMTVCMDLMKQQFGSASVSSVASFPMVKLQTAVMPLRVFFFCFFSLSAEHGLDLS